MLELVKVKYYINKNIVLSLFYVPSIQLYDAILNSDNNNKLKNIMLSAKIVNNFIL